MTTSIEDMVHAYATLHNRGVVSGDFRPMLELFHPRAELRFEGIPFGPCLGERAIAEAFSTHPPDDELVILSVTCGASGSVTAVYGWSTNPESVAGTLRFSVDGGKIKQLIITNDRVSAMLKPTRDANKHEVR
jgi:hypothetical protein